MVRTGDDMVEPFEIEPESPHTSSETRFWFLLDIKQKYNVHKFTKPYDVDVAQQHRFP